MELQLIALLLLASPMSAPHTRFAQFTARSESVSAVDASAARRFRMEEVTPPQAPYADDVTRRVRSLPAALGVIRAAEWVHSLPFGVGAHDGGFTFTLRFRV